MIGNSDDKIRFPYKSLTDKQAANLCQAFVNNSSIDIKL